MKLTVNGSEREVAESVRTAADLLVDLKLPRERVAMVINDAVVRRAELDAASLAEGDRVEVITMVGGG